MDRTLVLVVLLIAVIANVLFIGFALLTLRRRNEREEHTPAPGGILAAMPMTTTRLPTAGATPSLVGAAAPSAGVAPTASIIPPSTITTVVAMTDRPSDMPASTSASGRWSLPPHEDPRADATIDALVHGELGVVGAEPGEDPLIDPATGFATRIAWEDAFRNEDRRLARYGRPVTVIVAELDGLDALAARLGQDPADRLIAPVAMAMRREARAADILARVGHARFVGLMPETDEVAAINYIERVRTACDMWLAAGAVAVRLAIGWAQAPGGGRLDAAMRLADDRMNADRRRQAKTTAVPGESSAPPAVSTPPAPAVSTPPAAAVSTPPAPAVLVVPSAPAPEPTVVGPISTAPAAVATAEAGPASTSLPDPSFVPDGPYPGSNGNLPEPVPVIDGEKTYY